MWGQSLQEVATNPAPWGHLGTAQGEFQIHGALWKTLLAQRSGVLGWAPVKSSLVGMGLFPHGGASCRMFMGYFCGDFLFTNSCKNQKKLRM